MATIDLYRLAALLDEVAQAEIMPRWRTLEEVQIREKTGPLDLVTDADEAAEKMLVQRLPSLLAGSIVVGEESIEVDKSLFDLIGSDQPVWIVDPVDGTNNFAKGAERFCVMVALVHGDETLASAIHHPVSGETLLAEAGGGAILKSKEGERKLAVSSKTSLSKMRGSFNMRFLPDEVRPKAREAANTHLTDRHFRHGCAGYDYTQLAKANYEFCFYWKKMPWDHAPGLLIHKEAGGYSACLDGRPYLPRDLTGGLLVTPDRESWETFHAAVLAPLQL